MKRASWCNAWAAGVKIYTKLMIGVKSNTESETKREIAEGTLSERSGQEMAIYTDG